MPLESVNYDDTLQPPVLSWEPVPEDTVTALVSGVRTNREHLFVPTGKNHQQPQQRSCHPTFSPCNSVFCQVLLWWEKEDYGLRVKSTAELCTAQHTIYGKSAHCPLTLHSDTNADCLCCYSRRGIVLDLHAGAVGMGNRRGVVRCRRLWCTDRTSAICGQQLYQRQWNGILQSCSTLQSSHATVILYLVQQFTPNHKSI